MACPYVPDLNLASEAAMRGYGRFVVDVLLPRVRRETPALANPQATGIDGVSLGGRHRACASAFKTPRRSVRWVRFSRRSAPIKRQCSPIWPRGARTPEPRIEPAPPHQHTTTCTAAPSIGSRRRGAQAGIAHDFADVPGPHDYAFNRGPGAYELLAWHDRVLRKG